MVGGLDAGLCLGRACRVSRRDREEREEVVEALVVSIPDAELSLEVEEKVTAQTLRTVRRYVMYIYICTCLQKSKTPVFNKGLSLIMSLHNAIHISIIVGLCLSQI